MNKFLLNKFLPHLERKFSPQIQLIVDYPNLINIEPDGPNDSRDDMSLTYQSIIESIMSSFRIAISMKNFDVPLKNDILEKYKLDLDQITSQELFEKINLTITHHNNYELGPDRFNEGKNILKDKILPIFESVKNSENKIDASKKKFKELFDKEKIRKQKNWIPILKYHDDWLYEEMLELINLNEQILSNSTQNEQFDFLQNYLEKILGKSFPKINEMTEYKIIDSSDQKK